MSSDELFRHNSSQQIMPMRRGLARSALCAEELCQGYHLYYVLIIFRYGILQNQQLDIFTGSHIKKAYTRLGTSSRNAYTKSYCSLLMHICISMVIRLNAYTNGYFDV